MSILIMRPSAGTATPATPGEPTHPDVPLLHARIAWRQTALTLLPWNGASTAGWTTDGSPRSGPVTSLATTASDSFGGGSSFEMVTAGTAASGIDYALTGTFTSGRTYRLRAGVKLVSGSTSLVLRLGTAADSADVHGHHDDGLGVVHGGLDARATAPTPSPRCATVPPPRRRRASTTSRSTRPPTR